MDSVKVITLDYREVPLKIIFKGIGGQKKGYKIILSADKTGISINGDN